MQKLLTVNQFILYCILLFIGTIHLKAQSGSVEGVIKDANNGETLVGASILVQGTTTGTITDFDGNFKLGGLKPGNYNLVISYISYDQQIMRVEVKDVPVKIQVELKPASLNIESVKVTATRRTDTDMSLITSIKASSVVANGISSQQIGKSQDKDASEVIRRVPGITVVDDRFVVIRGLSQRYNSVLLNNSVAPSSESDVKAFSFDLIPSNMIDNMIIYKTPSPDLPADFAGGSVQIFTKNNASDNAFSLTCGTSINAQTTFNPFVTYKGSKTDWLGYDNGLRNIPSGFPSTADFPALTNNSGKTQEQINADRQTISELGQSFPKIWNVDTVQSVMPDQKLQLFFSHRFVIGKISVGTINSLNYSHSYDYNKVYRNQYYGTFNNYTNAPDTSYRFIDDTYKNSVKVGVISNWSFIFGKNQKIEFRNLFNQLGKSGAILRDGRDFYGGSYVRAHELNYQSRTIYSGQLGGQFNFFRDRTHFDFTLGYSYANKKEPDVRRVTWLENDDNVDLGYYIAVNNAVTPDNLGRIYLNNYERIRSAGFNLQQSFMLGSQKAEIKTGLYTENKNRSFSVRNIGFIQSSGQFDFRLRFVPLDSLFLDKNFSYPKGIRVGESTPLSDSYTASNELLAVFLKFNLPVFSFLALHGGIRLEKNNQSLTSGANKEPSARLDTLNFFPAAALNFSLSKKMLLRMAYGKSVNRPEFREIAPYSFFDFEDKEAYYGNPKLKNAYIQNYDVRFEWYPNNYDVFTLAGFYKNFTAPIELYLFPAGSNWNIQYQNAEKATSRGIEIDMRKSLAELGQGRFLTRQLSNFTFLFNAAFIRSVTIPDSSLLANSREKSRAMQGQSPYIVNAGIYYQNDSIGLMVSLLFNRIGRRLSFVGDKTIPHIWEMPRNSLDFTLTQKIGKHFQFKGGIVNLLNAPVYYESYLDVSVDTNGDGTGNKKEKKWMVTKSWVPGVMFNFNITYSL